MLRHLDASSEDVHQGFPLKIFRVLSKPSPIAPGSFGAIIVLSLLDLPGFLVPVRCMSTSGHGYGAMVRLTLV